MRKKKMCGRGEHGVQTRIERERARVGVGEGGESKNQVRKSRGKWEGKEYLGKRRKERKKERRGGGK